MRTLELDQAPSGQWKYRLIETVDKTRYLRVDWEWGTYDEKETIKQAEDRFGKVDKICILDWI